MKEKNSVSKEIAQVSLRVSSVTLTVTLAVMAFVYYGTRDIGYTVISGICTGVVSLLLLSRWELALRLYPERFSDTTNACVSCQNCEEKLCHHKTQLKSLLQKGSEAIYPQKRENGKKSKEK